MDIQSALFLFTVILTGILSRLPFLNFPLDDDFAIYTYRARFADRGFQWKKDLQIIGVPIWKMLLFDKVYGNPNGGVQRIRWLQTAFHTAASAAVFFAVLLMTDNPWAAWAAGLLHAFYGTSPDLTAGSFNHEQFYIPFVFLGLTLLGTGPENVFWAGLCFGAATIPKYSAGLYAAALMWVVGFLYGLEPMLNFAAAAAVPFLVSNLLDWKLGFWDGESKRQMDTRLATTLRITRTKKMYFNIPREIGGLARQTLPLWAAGFPGIALACFGEAGLSMGIFTAVTFSMIFFQRGFSRYHYLPSVALLALGSGVGIDALLAWGGIPATTILAALAGLTLWHVLSLKDFYLRPTDPKTLIRLEKYDQYLYLPHLGRLLNRLIRMRGEAPDRIFVWGTFSQLYHLTDIPASDNYLHYSIGPWDTPALEGFFDTVVGGLVRHKPVYLIKTYPDLDMDVLEQVTGLRYRLIKVVLARFPVYRLEGATSVPDNPLTLPLAEKMRVMETLTADLRHAPGISRDDFECGRVDTALRECRKLLHMNPRDADGWSYLADMLASLAQVDEAASCYEKVLDLEPFRQGPRLGLGHQRIKQNRLHEAKCLLNEEVRRFEYETEVSYLCGRIHRHEGQHRETAEEIDRVRTESPERIDCWEWESEALGHLKDASRLKELYNDTDRIDDLKDRQWVRTRLVTELAKIETDLRPEHETFDAYLQKDPENCLMQYARASALERADRKDAACDLFQQVASHTENYDHIRANAWFRLARLSPPDERETPARKCLELDPDHEGAKNLLNNVNRQANSGITPVQDSRSTTEKIC
ncbi:MAG: tetratricopeptide repeat protein [Nitrospinaceae bacterium]